MSDSDESGKSTYARLYITDQTLDENNLSKHCPLDNSRPKRNGEQDLGRLDTLPMELIHMILLDIDLESLTVFRRVNLRAAVVLDGVPEYHDIVAHAPNLLRGLLSIKLAKWTSCRTLFNTLCTATCETCGDFAGYVYLLTCSRVCFLCFSHDLAYLPMPFYKAMRVFDVPSSFLTSIPYMISMPGIYSGFSKKLSRSQRFFDIPSLLKARDRPPASLHPNETRKRAVKRPLRTVRGDEASVRWNRRRADRRAGRLTRGYHADFDGHDGGEDNPARFVAIVKAPYLDRKTHILNWGFHCSACRNLAKGTSLDFRRKFWDMTFKMHLSRDHNQSTSD